MQKGCKNIVVCKSCLTGHEVWLYLGQASEKSRLVYYRACRKEIERMARWAEKAAQRAQNIQRLMNLCLAQIPINAELTEQQKSAVRTLLAVKKKGMTCDREFYDHVVEEQNRRRTDKEIRAKQNMR